MSELRLRNVAVIVPTITGREDEFNRCMESLKLAEDLAPRGLGIRYFISKDTSREEILKSNIKEISECDMVTFVDDDDYVGRSFFSLPKMYSGDSIYTIKSLTITTEKFVYHERISGEHIKKKHPVIILGENLKAFSYYEVIPPVFFLQDCHLWGYFYPVKIIKELVEGLLIPRPEVTGPWEDVCYWSWIITHYGNNLRKLNSSIYFHTSLNNRSLVHKLTREIKSEKLDIVKSINKNLGLACLKSSGEFNKNFSNYLDFGPAIYGNSPYSLKDFIDLCEFKEHRLTKKEKVKFRKVIQHESWKDVDKEEFSKLLK